MNTVGTLVSPIGTLRIEAVEGALTSVRRARAGEEAQAGADDALVAEAVGQLAAWFEGRTHTLDLPVQPAATPFQEEVRALVRAIPWGLTKTYGELATALGSPDASRAVGAANAANPLWIVVPCHRVLGSGGRLVGYAGGLVAKRWLLDHEAPTPVLF